MAHLRVVGSGQVSQTWRSCGLFALVLTAGLLSGLLGPARPQYYDAKAYWALADSFSQEGGFSLLSFDDELRGYVFPLLLWAWRGGCAIFGASDRVAVVLLNAVLLAVLVVVLLPRCAQLVWPDLRLGGRRQIAVAAALLLFWSGYLEFALTDLPGLVAAVAALVLVSRTGSLPAALGAGVAAGVAVNLRPAYLLLLPAVVVLALLPAWEPRPTLLRRACAVTAVVLGLALVSVPQSLIAMRHLDSASPLPGAGEVPQSGVNLRDFQLTTGLELQRYDTYVGSELPGPQLRYLDPATEDLRAQLPDRQVKGYGAYVQLVVDHPATMAGVLLRHLVNGMDQRYSTPYVEELTGGSIALRTGSFVLLLLAALRLLVPSARRRLGRTRWPVLAALSALWVPSLTSAMETRFLLPLHLLVYVVVLLPSRSAADAGRRGRPWATGIVVLLGAVAYGVVVVRVVAAATRQLDVP